MISTGVPGGVGTLCPAGTGDTGIESSLQAASPSWRHFLSQGRVLIQLRRLSGTDHKKKKTRPISHQGQGLGPKATGSAPGSRDFSDRLQTPSFIHSSIHSGRGASFRGPVRKRCAWEQRTRSGCSSSLVSKVSEQLLM